MQPSSRQQFVMPTVITRITRITRRIISKAPATTGEGAFSAVQKPFDPQDTSSPLVSGPKGKGVQTTAAGTQSNSSEGVILTSEKGVQTEPISAKRGMPISAQDLKEASEDTYDGHAFMWKIPHNGTGEVRAESTGAIRVAEMGVIRPEEVDFVGEKFTFISVPLVPHEGDSPASPEPDLTAAREDPQENTPSLYVLKTVLPTRERRSYLTNSHAFTSEDITDLGKSSKLVSFKIGKRPILVDLQGTNYERGLQTSGNVHTKYTRKDSDVGQWLRDQGRDHKRFGEIWDKEGKTKMVALRGHCDSGMVREVFSGNLEPVADSPNKLLVVTLNSSSTQSAETYITSQIPPDKEKDLIKAVQSGASRFLSFPQATADNVGVYDFRMVRYDADQSKFPITPRGQSEVYKKLRNTTIETGKEGGGESKSLGFEDREATLEKENLGYRLTQTGSDKQIREWRIQNTRITTIGAEKEVAHFGHYDELYNECDRLYKTRKVGVNVLRMPGNLVAEFGGMLDSPIRSSISVPEHGGSKLLHPMYDHENKFVEHDYKGVVTEVNKAIFSDSDTLSAYEANPNDPRILHGKARIMTQIVMENNKAGTEPGQLIIATQEMKHEDIDRLGRAATQKEGEDKQANIQWTERGPVVTIGRSSINQQYDQSVLGR